MVGINHNSYRGSFGNLVPRARVALLRRNGKRGTLGSGDKVFQIEILLAVAIGRAGAGEPEVLWKTVRASLHSSGPVVEDGEFFFRLWWEGGGGRGEVVREMNR